ncbi:uracil-DNA glycosylase [Filobacillus milosensis]|uniref:Uracil-DNA glycosylase n=1 Tax=Filobacillus milosensis TaxID=94137 RepID=A0A4Y8IR10_9BACI|nr:uracil-DNA glycosylase [Filobacillus milosensis]TFB24018.1 uracil-DNA glycosylase [Filobacillus milosensis]
MEIKTDWKEYLESELNKTYFVKLVNGLDELYKKTKVYPQREEVFKALNQTPFRDTKVVIVGQDPYHGPGQAHGLSFSVKSNQKLPPSLRNIFKELVNDLNCKYPDHGDLTKWAKQGVLMLNTVLTVEESNANSHRNMGWEHFTDRILRLINDYKSNVVFILWGKQALNKGHFINQDKHLILHAPHPSPLSSYRGFFNSKPFSSANTYLKQHGIEPIEWCLKK